MRTQLRSLMAVGLAVVMALAITPAKPASAESTEAINNAIADAAKGNTGALAAMLASNSGNAADLAVITNAIAKSGNAQLIAAVMADTSKSGTAAGKAEAAAVAKAMATSLVAQATASLTGGGNPQAAMALVAQVAANVGSDPAALGALAGALNGAPPVVQTGVGYALGANSPIVQALANNGLNATALSAFNIGQSQTPIATVTAQTTPTITLPSPAQSKPGSPA